MKRSTKFDFPTCESPIKTTLSVSVTSLKDVVDDKGELDTGLSMLEESVLEVSCL